jgi:hypothetical protein
MVSVPGVCSSQEVKNVKGYDGLVKGNNGSYSKFIGDLDTYFGVYATPTTGRSTTAISPAPSKRARLLSL